MPVVAGAAGAGHVAGDFRFRAPARSRTGGKSWCRSSGSDEDPTFLSRGLQVQRAGVRRSILLNRAHPMSTPVPSDSDAIEPTDSITPATAPVVKPGPDYRRTRRASGRDGRGRAGGRRGGRGHRRGGLGPIGMLIGATIGAIAGGLAGHEVASRPGGPGDGGVARSSRCRRRVPG